MNAEPFREILQDQNSWWRSADARRASIYPVRRELQLEVVERVWRWADRRAVVVVGPRQVGKTVLLLQTADDLLTLSQVVLALQLPFAMFPLLWFTSSRRRMGTWKTGWLLAGAGWGSALLITTMDVVGLPDSVRTAWHVIAGG